jgi:hypothetical protein
MIPRPEGLPLCDVVLDIQEYLSRSFDRTCHITIFDDLVTVEEDIKTHPRCKIELIKIHLYWRFNTNRLREAFPPSVKHIVVLDKVRDITGFREPLFLDVAGALVNNRNEMVLKKPNFLLQNKILDRMGQIAESRSDQKNSQW